MGISRQKKEVIISSFKDNFQKSVGSFVVMIKGLAAHQIDSLRGELRNQGGTLKVAKIRLIKRAIQDIQEAKNLDEYLKDEVGFVFALQEAPPVAKALHLFSEKNEKLQILGGYFEQNVIDARMVQLLAMLPPREILLGQVVSAVQGPLRSCVTVLHMILVRLIFVIRHIEEQKAKS